MVLGLQPELHELRRDGCLPVAHPGKDAFYGMGEGHELIEVEHVARALDGVKAAERAVDGVGVGRILLELHQRALELGEELAGLFAKCLERIVVDLHVSPPRPRREA